MLNDVLCVLDCDEILRQMRSIYSSSKWRRHPNQRHGVFFSQYVSKVEQNVSVRQYRKLQKLVPGRRLSSTQLHSEIGTESAKAVRK